jgi:hypothetical protein
MHTREDCPAQKRSFRALPYRPMSSCATTSTNHTFPFSTRWITRSLNRPGLVVILLRLHWLIRMPGVEACFRRAITTPVHALLLSVAQLLVTPVPALRPLCIQERPFPGHGALSLSSSGDPGGPAPLLPWTCSSNAPPGSRPLPRPRDAPSRDDGPELVPGHERRGHELIGAMVCLLEEDERGVLVPDSEIATNALGQGVASALVDCQKCHFTLRIGLCPFWEWTPRPTWTQGLGRPPAARRKHAKATRAELDVAR